MYKLGIAVLTCATAATLLVALVAPGTADSAPRANVCDVEGLWAASAFGSQVGNSGAVSFDIFDQAPPTMEDDDGSDTFDLATQLALGLGNAGEGDKYHFRFETVADAPFMATARGHGFLFVPDSGMATFVIAGKGTHPLAGPGETPGSFTLSGGGDVTCALEEGTVGDANVEVVWEDGTMDNVFVNMLRCLPGDPCEPPGD